MNIKLNVSKNTFKKYLITMGYSLDVRQYEDMIFSIKRQARQEIINSIENLNIRETMYNIFNKEVSLLILEDIEEVKEVSTNFIKKIIENNNLDGYLEKKEEEFSEEEQRDAYKIKVIKNIKINKKNIKTILFSKYRKELTINNEGRAKLQRCIHQNKINISKEIKEEIHKEINTNLKKVIIKNNINKIERIEKEISIVFLKNIKGKLSKYIEENILPNDLINEKDFNFNLLKRSDKKDGLFYYIQDISSSLSEKEGEEKLEFGFHILEYIREEISFKELCKKYPFPSKSGLNTKLSFLLSSGAYGRIKNFEKPLAKDINLRVLFSKNEYIFSYQDILDFDE